MFLEKFAGPSKTSDYPDGKNLRSDSDITPNIARQLEDFIRGCQCLVTGALSWRFVAAAF